MAAFSADGSPRVLCFMLGALAGLTVLVEAGSSSFLRSQVPGEVNVADVTTSLVAELAGNASSERLSELEDSLRTTYMALPKGTDGFLGHQAVRYVLHRMFVQRRGWFITGLEPTDNAPPPYLQGEWVPSYLQGLLEERLGGRGIDLKELAALAASLEDLVHREAAGRLEAVYSMLRLNAHGDVIEAKKADDVLVTYMIMYLQDGNFSVLSPQQLSRKRQLFEERYTDWGDTEEWLREIEGRHVNAEGGGLDFTAASRIVDEIGEKFGSFNDKECQALKTTLMGMEDQKPGRVRLTDFYQKGLHSHWQFNEKVGYLRALGALDESEVGQPRVILANYLGSRPNCLEASSLYAVCCRNECEDLMGSLEREIAATEATPERIAALVAALSSNTVQAPRALSTNLVQRLSEIASQNGGKVPLHGRLFAQWLHHAYPRECPYPHPVGSIGPMTPDAWLDEEGQETLQASEEEIRTHMGDAAAIEGAASVTSELPWSDDEALFGVHVTAAAEPAQERSSSSGFSGLSLFLLAIWLPVLVAVALALVIWRPRALHEAARRRASCGDLLGDELMGNEAVDASKWRMLLLFCVVAALGKFSGLLHAGAFGCALVVGLVMLVANARLAARGPMPGKQHSKCCVE